MISFERSESTSSSPRDKSNLSVLSAEAALSSSEYAFAYTSTDNIRISLASANDLPVFFCKIADNFFMMKYLFVNI